MSDATVPSADEGTAEEYRRPAHLERYGLAQYQMSVGNGNRLSISWSGSACEMIEDAAREEWTAVNPRGVAYATFQRNETGVLVRTWPELKGLWLLITDEIDRRRINKRQRKSLHRVRDKLADAHEETEDDLRRRAGEYYNGHQFRSRGEIPKPSYPKDEMVLSRDVDVAEDEFIEGRVKYHLGSGPVAYGTQHPSAKRQGITEDDVERVVSEIPLMYGYDDDV